MTSGVDQMVALHTSIQDDVLLCLQRGELSPKQDRVGELVGTLVDHFTRSVPRMKQATRDDVLKPRQIRGSPGPGFGLASGPQGHGLGLVAPLKSRGTNRK